MTRSRAVGCLLALSALVITSVGYPAQRGGAHVRREGNSLSLGNPFVELDFVLGEHRCVATCLVNKLSRRKIPLQSDDFSMEIEGRGILHAADFSFKEARKETVPTGQRLTLHYENASKDIKLKVIYELNNHDFFLRRHLEVAVAGPLMLKQVEVWLIGLKGICSHQGFGEPVLLEDCFSGLEFPGGHDSYADGVVRLTQYPGRRVTDRFVSKTAVLGVAEPGRVALRFGHYLESLQVTPKESRLFVNYNTWWTLMPPTEENSLALIDLFKRRLYDPYGESFDTFTLDDGWDNKDSLWEIRGDRFPRGFGPLKDALKPMKARLGLWLSPSSGYNHAPWGGANGYERNSYDWFLCQSGPRYRHDIVKVVTGLAEKYDMAFFKFDGFCASCEATNHGHLPGPYAQEANIDAYIELLQAVRAKRPGIYLDPTCGIWLSPWWLMYADSLWGDVSGDYPDVIVPTPIAKDSATTTRDALFRQRCKEHPGFPTTAIEHLGIIVITEEKWEDDAMAVVGRGCRLLTLYIDPKLFRKGERDWAFLASLLKWLRYNAATLQHTRLVLGDPFKREAYGFAHFRERRGIISLRNPFVEPQTAKLKLDESVGWSPSDSAGHNLRKVPFVVKMIYPREETLPTVARYGEVIQVKLQAYETITLQVQPVTTKGPVLLGVRFHETGRVDKKVTYAVYGRAGQSPTVCVAGGPRVRKAWLNGQPLTVSMRQGLVRLPLTFSGGPRGSSVQQSTLKTESPQDAGRILGSCVVTVPPDAKATIHVLCDPTANNQSDVVCAAEVNGKSVQVRSTESPRSNAQVHSQYPWTWFEFDVPAGQSEVSVSLTPSHKSPFFRAKVGWWLWVENPLSKADLTLEFKGALPPAEAEPLPMPVNMDTEREVVTLQAPKPFLLGNRWPSPDQTVVYLDETSPDEVSQDWGKPQKNQSVWEKEMIIAGRKFTRGLGTHGNGRLAYDLAEGNFHRFRCMVGRDQHAGDGRIVFQVWVDRKNVFDSGPMTQASAAKPVDLDVTGATLLELLTLDGGDGIMGDHGDWADARLER